MPSRWWILSISFSLPLLFSPWNLWELFPWPLLAISVKGSTSVHLVGYFEGSYEDDEPGEDVEDDGYSDEEGHDEEDEDDDSYPLKINIYLSSKNPFSL